MTYEILESDSASKLTELVNAHLKSGWDLVGGVAVGVDTRQWMNEREGHEEFQTDITWSQAMIRRENVADQRRAAVAAQRNQLALEAIVAMYEAHPHLMAGDSDLASNLAEIARLAVRLG